VFGDAGARVLAFPPSKHPFYDWENRGLVASLHDRLARGELQLFCVDQVDAESWYGWGLPPARRAQRYGEYQRYLVEEVVPFTLQVNADPYLIVAGPSFGALHAVNFALHHPELVGRVLGMSGIYDIKRFTGGSCDDGVCFSNPVD